MLYSVLLAAILGFSLISGRRFFQVRMRELLARNTDELTAAAPARG